MLDARHFQSLGNRILLIVIDCFQGENNDADDVFLQGLFICRFD